MRAFSVALLFSLASMTAMAWIVGEPEMPPAPEKLQQASVVAASESDQPVEFSLPDMNGKTQHLKQFRGKWVVVNFWATWCIPCLKELPELQSFHDAHKDEKAVVVGVNMESIESDKLRTFVEKQSITFPIWHMEPASDTPLGQVIGMPTTFMVDPAGVVVAQEIGTVTAEMLQGFIQRYEAGELAKGAQ